MFGLLKKRASAEVLARTIAQYALNPGGCMQMVSMMRGYGVDDEVLMAETALLRASYVRGIFRQRCSEKAYRKMAESLLATVLDTFRNTASMKSGTLKDYYNDLPMSQVVKSRLEDYAQKEDAPALTCPAFCARMKAPGIVSNIEVQKMLDDFLGAHVNKALDNVRAV